jgi:GntR family transcriptional regulator, transcriptional repressor for pyruvate dehydrogenase complex
MSKEGVMAGDDPRAARPDENRFRWSASSGRAGAKDIARRIREAVTVGTLQPGDRLPGEHELAASFDVARGTVREALQSLAASGLVRSTRGSQGGTFVTVPEADWVVQQLGDLLGLWFQVGDINLADVLEAREVLEHACIVRAIEKRTEDDLARMRAAIERSRQPDISDEEFIDADLAFHTAVSDAAKNPILGLAMSAVHLARPRTNRLLLRGLDRPVIADQHWAMYEAIRDQDARRATDALEAHIGHLDAVRMTELPDLDPRTIPIAPPDPEHG